MQGGEALLSNVYVCGKKAKGHLLPATEFLLSASLTFEITPKSVQFLSQLFNYDRHTWFKFVIIHDTITCKTKTNDHDQDRYYRMFVCNGSTLTRHSVIYIDALAHILTDIENDPDCTLDAKYYPYLKTYRELVACKESKRGGVLCKDRIRQLKYSLNSEINKHFECMKVVSAGSGTVFVHNGASVEHGEKYHICLNTKSGHYRPSLKDVELAKRVLLDIIRKVSCSKTREQFKVIAQYKPNKKTLKKIFGENIAETKVGLCLPKKKQGSRRRRRIRLIRRTIKNKK
jgi:hypothetical protein